METNVTLERAWQLLQQLVARQKRQTLTVALEQALGHVLAEDYKATTNFPPFQRSRMDGFAVNSSVARALKGRLPLGGIVPAGYVQPELDADQSHAIEIMTGALIPAGTNAVVKKEECRRQGEFLQLLHLPEPGEHLNLVGEEFAQGQQLIAAGTRLKGKEISLLAMDGATQVTVVAKPSIGILTTGTELQSLGEELQPGHIFNSNYYGIAGELASHGYQVDNLGVISDDLGSIVASLKAGVNNYSVLITTGGVAGSKYDLLLAAIEQIGGTISFWKLDLRPGTPVVVASCGTTIIVALSGNPPAAFFGLSLICRPLLSWLEGQAHGIPTLEARLQGARDLHVKGSGRQLYKGNLAYHDGQVFVTPVSARSGILRYLASGCCYIIAEAGVELMDGQIVKVLIAE